MANKMLALNLNVRMVGLNQNQNLNLVRFTFSFNPGCTLNLRPLGPGSLQQQTTTTQLVCLWGQSQNLLFKCTLGGKRISHFLGNCQFLPFKSIGVSVWKDSHTCTLNGSFPDGGNVRLILLGFYGCYL